MAKRKRYETRSITLINRGIERDPIADAIAEIDGMTDAELSEYVDRKRAEFDRAFTRACTDSSVIA
jgi:hypothetical protein